MEDDAALRAVVREVLQAAGYAVLECGSPEQALALADGHKGPLHLLLTDVVMPGMSGRALAEGLGRLRPRVKVFYMSGYTDNAILHHGILEEGVHFLSKPFTPDVLLRRIRETLDQAG